MEESSEPKHGEPLPELRPAEPALAEAAEVVATEPAAEAEESKIEPPVEFRESEIESIMEAEELEIEATVEAKASEIQLAAETTEGAIAPDGVEKDTPAAAAAKVGPLTPDGGRTLTMREILNGIKAEEKGATGSGASGGDLRRDGAPASPSYSQDGLQQHYVGQNDVAMDLINNVTGVDEEGRSRQRILAFAARKYASAIERDPENHDAYYNWALVLQESADNVGPENNATKDALLEEACKKYDEATRICPTLQDAYYNWAIAISDRAKMRGRTKEAEELWKQATKNYERSVQLSWNSPQALNNWGLALQELSAIVPAREKPTIVRTAISKFRAAIRLQFDFHRAIYNLGTVLYALAEDTLRSGRPVNAKEVSPNELYSQSAIYIAAAHALKPNYSVYRSALRLVRSMLPLPYLKVGYLTAPPADKRIAPHKDWERSQFVLNHEGLQQVSWGDKHLSQSPSGKLQGCPQKDKSLIKIDIPDIVSVSACADLTLPSGAGLCVDTIHGPVYLVADTWESLDGWMDAIRLVYTIFSRGKSDVLAGIITG